MSATSVATAFDATAIRRIPLGVVRDTLAIARRNLIAYRRVPQLLVFSTIQPVIFVLMFRYVFGGAVGESLPRASLRRLPDARHLRADGGRSARSRPRSGWPRT